MRTTKYDEGYDKGYDAGQQNGYRAGIEEGKKQKQKEIDTAWRQACINLVQAAANMQESCTRLIMYIERQG